MKPGFHSVPPGRKTRDAVLAGLARLKSYFLEPHAEAGGLRDRHRPRQDLHGRGPAGAELGRRGLTKLSWSSWNLNEAAGTGVYSIDTCPSCIQPKLQHQEVVVVLWRPTPTVHHASRYEYSKMTLLFPAAGKTQTMTLPSY